MDRGKRVVTLCGVALRRLGLRVAHSSARCQSYQGACVRTAHQRASLWLVIVAVKLRGAVVDAQNRSSVMALVPTN
jgi:hypothetical protein